MSCFYCEYYVGINLYCRKAHYVETGSESINCDDYEYNGECKT